MKTDIKEAEKQKEQDSDNKLERLPLLQRDAKAKKAVEYLKSVGLTPEIYQKEYEMKSYKQKKQQILNSISTSYTLKKLIELSENRDSLDALRDAEILVDLLKLRCLKEIPLKGE